MSKKKQQFEVEEHESIDDCLARMKDAGFMPVRRMEKPIFVEKVVNGKKEHVPVRQRIIFEGMPIN